MDQIFGGLARALGEGIAGLVGGAFQAMGAAVQQIVAIFQGILPGFWLPVVAIAVVLVVGWQLVKR
jgi:hypothetical protein